ncbi:MAG TPA: hypothetical protein VGI89_03830 [Rhizomicrobium sp.]
MNDKTIASRREALAFVSLATSFVIGGDATGAQPVKTGKAARPGAEEMARAKSLYGGELGGFKGAR